ARSGGQRKRASIGVELLTRPRVFFLDEPTSGLDPATDAQMMRLLRRLADDGGTVVLTTHATRNVMLCDRIVFLARGGHLAFVGTPRRAPPPGSRRGDRPAAARRLRRAAGPRAPVAPVRGAQPAERRPAGPEPIAADPAPGPTGRDHPAPADALRGRGLQSRRREPGD